MTTNTTTNYRHKTYSIFDKMSDQDYEYILSLAKEMLLKKSGEQSGSKKTYRTPGSLKGKVEYKLSDDFDTPMEEFKEYM